MIDSIIQRGLSAIQQGLQEANSSSERLSKAFNTDSEEDPVSAIVDLQSAKRTVQAGAKVVKVGDEMLGAVLDIIG